MLLSFFAIKNEIIYIIINIVVCDGTNAGTIRVRLIFRLVFPFFQFYFTAPLEKMPYNLPFTKNISILF